MEVLVLGTLFVPCDRTTADRSTIVTRSATAPRVDILFDARAAPREMPTHAITDGSADPIHVEARPFTYRFRRVRVVLPVDARTARRFALFERLTLLHTVVTLPLVLLVWAAFVAGLVMARRAGPNVAPPFITAGDAVGIEALLGILLLATIAGKPSQYPRTLIPVGVVIGRADRAAAEEWAALNPPGAMTLRLRP